MLKGVLAEFQNDLRNMLTIFSKHRIMLKDCLVVKSRSLKMIRKVMSLMTVCLQGTMTVQFQHIFSVRSWHHKGNMENCFDQVKDFAGEPVYDVYDDELSMETVYNVYHGEVKIHDEEVEFPIQKGEDIQCSQELWASKNSTRKMKFPSSQDMSDLDSMDKKKMVTLRIFQSFMRVLIVNHQIAEDVRIFCMTVRKILTTSFVAI